ncbi:hypothetical protein AYI68_g6773, partial [Smittium mucronatum]
MTTCNLSHPAYLKQCQGGGSFGCRLHHFPVGTQLAVR